MRRCGSVSWMGFEPTPLPCKSTGRGAPEQSRHRCRTARGPRDALAVEHAGSRAFPHLRRIPGASVTRARWQVYSSLSIENLRSITRLDIEHLGQVTLLTGRNGAGKTTVMEALFLLA